MRRSEPHFSFAIAAFHTSGHHTFIGHVAQAPFRPKSFCLCALGGTYSAGGGRSITMEISVRGLRKSFPGKDSDFLLVLDGVDLYVEHGEFVTLIGPSGCGKTTILKIIAGIERADGGEIRLPPNAPNGSLPIIWQEHRLLPWRTVLKNVQLPLEFKNVEPATADPDRGIEGPQFQFLLQANRYCVI